MLPFHCSRCGHNVFFDNSACGQCGACLGFLPAAMQMVALDDTRADAQGRWPVCAAAAQAGAQPDDAPASEAAALRPCANRLQYGVCNWMLDDGDAAALCRSCRLTEILPDLAADPRHHSRWAAIERAKRRLLFTLIGIGLAPQPRSGPDDHRGLGYRLLAPLPGEPAPVTGHDDGLITLNVEEADDDLREATRVSMDEEQRTLLGHLRHETAHYLQYRWIDGTPAADTCREVFGDERADYATALARHYAEGPPEDWPRQFISAYASAHPWEDWAETCAHCLLVIDAVQTAAAWGLQLGTAAASNANPVAPDSTTAPIDQLALHQWLPVAQFLNAMNRSLGLRDPYPYLLPDPVLAKMAAVQRLLGAASRGPAVSAPPTPAAACSVGAC
jgi:hypothetical protein